MIDQHAVISPDASIALGVEVGPYSIIGAGVEIEAGTWIGPHVVIKGPTRIGPDNRIYQFCSIGEDPQDKKYAGEPTRLEIGARNTIRESCTINRGTAQDRNVTTIGDDNWIMAYVHIAHDCDVGNNIIMANATTLAGHVSVGDWAILGGFTKAHQFCRIGAHAFTAMDCAISRDLPPYVMAAGHLALPRGINSEGLQRRGFSREQISRIKKAYKILYRSDLRLAEAIDKLRELATGHEEIGLLVRFLETSERSIIR
ncbi:MAG: acyl-ACP--UDP-N-acetylglucosamine O-acyltransferase [Gammaproteobacteria bacterium]|nr:acyl-ACP--UDP-N-acetylglucosamine O-acyltransferase [Gammaproteobacteria bacterium]NNF59825.1 acyl-ACP--UDP-N-acetylglucosamine O-acyltransferase [Gammaproteobacteria bacterium]NNM21301.1 acyl-ACP--UDP-N-acetylglucosamine O-acyltransferase [Gammaproteobacteria bacterium]